MFFLLLVRTVGRVLDVGGGRTRPTVTRRMVEATSAECYCSVTCWHILQCESFSRGCKMRTWGSTWKSLKYAPHLQYFDMKHDRRNGSQRQRLGRRRERSFPLFLNIPCPQHWFQTTKSSCSLFVTLETRSNIKSFSDKQITHNHHGKIYWQEIFHLVRLFRRREKQEGGDTRRCDLPCWRECHSKIHAGCWKGFCQGSGNDRQGFSEVCQGSRQDSHKYCYSQRSRLSMERIATHRKETPKYSQAIGRVLLEDIIALGWYSF